MAVALTRKWGIGARLFGEVTQQQGDETYVGVVGRKNKVRTMNGLSYERRD